MPCDCGKPAGPVCNTKGTQNKGHTKVAPSRTTETLRGFWPGPHSTPFLGRRFEFSLCVRVTGVRIQSFPCIYTPSTIRITYKKLKKIRFPHSFISSTNTYWCWQFRDHIPSPGIKERHHPSLQGGPSVRHLALPRSLLGWQKLKPFQNVGPCGFPTLFLGIPLPSTPLSRII